MNKRFFTAINTAISPATATTIATAILLISSALTLQPSPAFTSNTTPISISAPTASNPTASDPTISVTAASATTSVQNTTNQPIQKIEQNIKTKFN